MAMRSKLSVCVEEAFFAAMREGWAGGNDGTLVAGFERWKQTEYTVRRGVHDLNVVDRWGSLITLGSDVPTGSTLITDCALPAWVMWYGGDSYNKDVIPFLRAALMESYSKNLFCGGRGPGTYRKGNLLYTNKYEGDFFQFSGHEYIEYIRDNGDKENAGSHRYWGGSLLFTC